MSQNDFKGFRFRESTRAPFETEVKLSFDRFGGSAVGYAADISMEGMFVKTNEPKPVGTLVQFEFQLKDEGEVIQGLGDVVWIRVRPLGPNQPAGMGIQYRYLDPHSREAIFKIVDKYLKDSRTDDPTDEGEQGVGTPGSPAQPLPSNLPNQAPETFRAAARGAQPGAPPMPPPQPPSLAQPNADETLEDLASSVMGDVVSTLEGASLPGLLHAESSEAARDEMLAGSGVPRTPTHTSPPTPGSPRPSSPFAAPAPLSAPRPDAEVADFSVSGYYGLEPDGGADRKRVRQLILIGAVLVVGVGAAAGFWFRQSLLEVFRGAPKGETGVHAATPTVEGSEGETQPQDEVASPRRTDASTPDLADGGLPPGSVGSSPQSDPVADSQPPAVSADGRRGPTSLGAPVSGRGSSAAELTRIERILWSSEPGATLVTVVGDAPIPPQGFYHFSLTDAQPRFVVVVHGVRQPYEVVQVSSPQLRRVRSGVHTDDGNSLHLVFDLTGPRVRAVVESDGTNLLVRLAGGDGT